MNRFVATSICLFWLFLGHAQSSGDAKTPVTSSATNFYSQSFSYPLLPHGEMHANYLLGYQLNNRFAMELQAFYDRYITGDLMKIAIRARVNLDDRFYLFSGLGVQYERGLYTHSRPSFFINNGIGFDATPQWNIEANHELQLNSANYGNFSAPSVFAIKGKFKF